MEGAARPGFHAGRPEEALPEGRALQRRWPGNGLFRGYRGSHWLFPGSVLSYWTLVDANFSPSGRGRSLSWPFFPDEKP